MNSRFYIFIAGLTLFLLWGWLRPYRPNIRLTYRWPNNILLIATSSIPLTLLVPGGLFLVAQKIEQLGFGLLNRVGLPSFLESIITFILLDLVIYGQHVFTHYQPHLWRLHRVHHSDPEFDTTTALRFHPLEIFFSFLIKSFFIVIFGLDKYGVVIFEILLNLSAMFNHSNITFPQSVEKILRKITVTPDFHRVHHSPHKTETNSNFGFFLPWWDYLFQTYKKEVADPRPERKIGLSRFRDKKDQNILKLLIQPFK